MKENSCSPWKQTSQEIFNPSPSFPFTRAMTFLMWLNRQYGVHTANDFFTRQSNLSKRQVRPEVTHVEEICYSVCDTVRSGRNLRTFRRSLMFLSFVWKSRAPGNNALLKRWLQGVATSQPTEFFIFITVKPQISKASKLCIRSHLDRSWVRIPAKQWMFV